MNDHAAQGDAAAASEPDRASLRRQAFIAAASEVFLTQGYANASMAEIVRRAGGSLSTLYSQFGDKKGLFLAVFDRGIDEFTGQIEVETAAHTPVREGLQRIGERFLQRLMSAQSLDMFRLVIGQTKQFPELAQEYVRMGPERVRRALAAYLADRVAAKELDIANVELAAAAFTDLVRSRMHLRALIDPGFSPDEDAMRAHVAWAVKFFLGGAEAG